MAYYNFRTNTWDYLTQPPADWIDYIPQHKSEQALYRLYQEAYGDTPIEAARKVLERCVPSKVSV